MEGLLNKALKIRRSLQKLDGNHSGDADQEDIQRQIELAISQSKIQVTPELFSFKAKNRGIVLPLIVNFGTLLVLSLGIAILALVFSRQQSQQEIALVQLHSAEGTVIAELKRQADAKMAEKEKEIAGINLKLSDIAAQRDHLATNMQSAISARESQLRREMQNQLDAERQRLRGLGLSEDEVNRRMKIFEKQKTDEFNTKLAQYRKEAEDERRKHEEALKIQETAFTQNLTKANQDRAGLVAESQKREEELRRQLLAQQNQAANQANITQSQIADAENQIRKLAQAREQERTAASQIAGFYSTLKTQLGAANWVKAEETLGLLKTFLNSPQILEIDSLRQRRETELFVAESLGALIEKEKNPPPAQTQTGTASPEPIANQEALAAALKTAQDQYKAELARVQAEADAVQKKLLEQRDTDAARLLKQQAASLNAEIAKLKQNIADQTVTIGALQASIDSQKADLATLQASADSNAKRADQAEADLKAVSTGQVAQLIANQRALELRIQTLDKENVALTSKLTLSGTDLEIAKNAVAANQAERKKIGDELAAKEAQLVALRTEGEKNRGLAESYNNMVKIWSDYIKADNQRKAALGTKPVTPEISVKDQMAGKVLFDSFLANADIKKTFPGLYDRVHSFDDANYKSGRDSLLPTLGDKLYDIASIANREDRLNRLQAEIKNAPNQASKEFYQNLYDLIMLESGKQ